MLELVALGFIAAGLWAAWPSCSRRARWWLIATITLLPFLAGPCWLIHGARYRLRRRRQLYVITVPVPGGLLSFSDRSIPYGPDRRAHRRQRRREAQRPRYKPLTPTQHRDSVRFWEECQRTGTPTEQALAPQMLAFLDDLAPWRVINVDSDSWPDPRLLDTEY